MVIIIIGGIFYIWAWDGYIRYSKKYGFIVLIGLF